MAVSLLKLAEIAPNGDEAKSRLARAVAIFAATAGAQLDEAAAKALLAKNNAERGGGARVGPPGREDAHQFSCGRGRT